MNVKKIFFLFSVILISTSLISCNSKNKIEITPFEEEGILPDLSWILVTVPYAPVREDCDFSSNVVSQIRKGEVFEVMGSRLVEYKASKDEDEIAPSLWYKIDSGWVESRNVNLYDTKLKALNAKN